MHLDVSQGIVSLFLMNTSKFVPAIGKVIGFEDDIAIINCLVIIISKYKTV